MDADAISVRLTFHPAGTGIHDLSSRCHDLVPGKIQRRTNSRFLGISLLQASSILGFHNLELRSSKLHSGGTDSFWRHLLRAKSTLAPLNHVDCGCGAV